MNLPQARNTELVVQDLGKELLVYDLKTNRAFNLNETSKIVFFACGEGRSFDDLKRKYKFTEDLIYLTLDRLRDEDLIEDYQSKFKSVSRREAIKRAGLASMIALPVISSLVAPQASQAASVVAALRNGEICVSNSQCVSKQCGTQGFGPYCCSADNFETCATSSDCCSGIACTDNVCCQGTGQTCDTRANVCCSGLTCVAAAGQTNGQCQ